MKKIITMAAAGALALSLAGCAQQAEPIAQNDPPSTEAKQNERQPLSVAETGYFMDEFGSAHYAVIIENENMDAAAELVNMKITSKDADGKIIGSEDAYLTLLFANGKTALCGTTYSAQNAATLEFQIVESPNMWQHETMQQAEFDEAFYVQNINESTGEYGDTTVAGEIVNTGSAGFSAASINAVFRDANGAIVGGATTTISSVPADSTVPFSIDYIPNVPEHAKVDVYVDCGYPSES